MFSRFLVAALLMIAALSHAQAASTINSLPAITTGTYPLTDPGCASTSTENFWITQGPGDYKIDALRAGYIFQGSSAPSCPFAYQLWWDTSTTIKALKAYTGASWVTISRFDTSNALWTPPIGGGTIPTIASSSTTDLCSSGSTPQAIVNISGSTTIDSFGSNCAAGTIKIVNFLGTPQITYGASSIRLPGSASITPQTNDVWALAYLGSGVWQLYFLQPAASFAGVTSFNGRTGAVLPASNDYSFGQISGLISVTQMPPTGAVGGATNVAGSLTAANTSVVITADSVNVATGLSGVTASLGSYSKTFNGATTGAGGMDTGSLPVSGYVCIYAIYGASGTSILGVNCATSSATIYAGANMPPGYTYSALLAVWRTSGTPNMVAGYVIGRKFLYQTPSTVLSASTISRSSYTALNISAAVPPSAKECFGYLSMTSDASVSTVSSAALYVAGDSSGAAPQPLQFSPTAAVRSYATSFSNLPLPNSQTLYYLTSSTVDAHLTATIVINGYTW